MSILVDSSTRVLVQGITGTQARFDTEGCLRYGTAIVAGVTPGHGGEQVHGVPVFDTVRRAVAAFAADTALICVPPANARDAVVEAIEAGIRQLVVTAEFVPIHDVLQMTALARRADVRMIGCNTNGAISPGRCKVGGIGGPHPDAIYAPGRIGVCSRSGGMTAEVALALKAAGMGVSTAVAMGGDAITGLRMADYVRMFERDADTDAIVLVGEPGTDNEQEVAALLARGEIGKPVVALIAGQFQERYPAGMSFGHAAAMISDAGKSASAKRDALRDAGARIALSLEAIPSLFRPALN